MLQVNRTQILEIGAFIIQSGGKDHNGFTKQEVHSKSLRNNFEQRTPKAVFVQLHPIALLRTYISPTSLAGY